jgi:hypothetical protein
MSTYDPARLYWSVGGVSGDMGQSIVGEILPMEGNRHASFFFSWTATGAPIGTLSFEVSDDGVNFEALPASMFPGMAQPAGVAGTSLVDVIETDAAYIRARYTRTGGGAGAVLTGTISRKE